MNNLPYPKPLPFCEIALRAIAKARGSAAHAPAALALKNIICGYIAPLFIFFLGITLRSRASRLDLRFKHPRIRHTIERLCDKGS